ncbi:WD40-repeat-containing domain protein [Ephemerocybe angulata]|uniref:WD40-repeat-containing domain protein n=1 Tax=Ephemerocybe angulata TaxID=980116 RepID=A0A8H6HDC5_9AGAR|nr:WD40-repeat-containing domain protein [Tulosesus angulatus]
MPDAFFASTKTRKRKRSGEDGAASRNSRKPGGGRAETKGQRGAKDKAPPKKSRRDEELSDNTDDEGMDIDDMDLRADDEEEPSGDEYENETPAEKRLRLAKLYLESVKGAIHAEGEFDAADIDREIIASRLKQDVLEHAGKVHLFIADSFDFSEPPQAVFHARGHRLSVTSSTVSESAKYMFTAGKEGSIIQWDLLTGKKLSTFYKIKPTTEQKGKGKAKAAPDASISGHTDEVYSLAISGDGKLLASAGADRRVGIWDVEKGTWIKGFAGHLGHKDAVSHVAFKKGTNQLYSGSFDRTLKVYDLSPGVMGYVETLFGHQDHILSLDALRGDVCVSVGARDKTVRYWKIVDETQLVFRGGGRSRIREVLEGGLKGDEEGDGNDSDSGAPKKQQKQTSYIEGSLETVCMIDETTFVSGGDSGSISLWSTQKKKPIFTQPLGHGLDETESSTEGLLRTPRWVTSLSSLRYSNIFASGSYDGTIRIWQLDAKLKSFSLAGTIPAAGIVNSLQLLSPPKEFVKNSSWISEASQSSNPPLTPGPNPLLIVASLGKEHRFGRWLKQKEAKNATSVYFFSSRTSSSS